VITPYLHDGASVITDVATTSAILSTQASTTNTFFFATTTSTSTSTFTTHPEYEYVTSLFGTSTATSSSIVDTVVSGVEGAFRFATSERATTATTTRIDEDVVLVARDADVYAQWHGRPAERPYYYCIDHESASSTIARYGAHVYDSIEDILASSPSEHIFVQNDRTRVCRDEIRIDRKRQNVHDFDFFPGSTDHVLMVLADGLYVVEIDDRAWQNTQLLYPGSRLRVAVDGGQIFVYDGERYFEVFTELIDA